MENEKAITKYFVFIFGGSFIFLVLDIIFYLIWGKLECDQPFSRLVLGFIVQRSLMCTFFIMSIFNTNLIYVMIIYTFTILSGIFYFPWYIYSFHIFTHTFDCKHNTPYIYNLLVAELLLPLIVTGIMFVRLTYLTIKNTKKEESIDSLL